MTDGEKPKQDSASAAKTYLAKHGYPLEFRVAHQLHRRGYFVWPGYYPQPPAGKRAREVDIFAARVMRCFDGGMISIDSLVECKWTGKGPWVFFVSEHAAFGSIDAVGRAYGNEPASALLWLVNRDPEVADLAPFTVPNRPAYGGVATYSNRDGAPGSGRLDRVYATMQGMAEAMEREAAQRQVAGEFSLLDFQVCSLMFPLVVSSHPIMEARYDPSIDDVVVDEVVHTRVLWRAPRRADGGNILIDVVARDALGPYLDRWTADADVLMKKLDAARKLVMSAAVERNIAPLLPLLGARYTDERSYLPRALKWLERGS